MTHPYKPTIFALNTHKLAVLPDPKDRARSIEIRRQRHLASLLRARATDAPEVGHRRARWRLANRGVFERPLCDRFQETEKPRLWSNRRRGCMHFLE
jgi:hypothetical protein